MTQLPELLRRVGVNGGEPEGELVCEVVARPPPPGALYEGRGSEVLQAGAGGGQGLAAALGASSGVLSGGRARTELIMAR